jgi:acetyltransferase-like isoleucine patch superfamily enzyme
MASFVPGGSHRSDLVSTFPFDSDRTYSHGDSITVGNDVYICEFAYIGGRASIGNGAIVGANAVVFNSVPAYSIVVGNPAKIVRFRFSVDTISALQNIAWWNWPHNKIMERIEWFYGPVEEFIREFKN